MSQPVQTPPEFGKVRSYLWPIHSYELKKIIPMILMFFLILFNYTVLRDTKDVLVVSQVGAQALPFLKVYGTVPLAIVFMIIYSKLSNSLSKPKLFYASVVPFLIFFAAFALIMYPLRELLAPHGLANWLQNALPSGLDGISGMIRYWTFSLFYCMAELWGSVVLSLLFWGFANDTTRVSEAKRFYSLFGLFGNFALLSSGPAIMFFSRITKGPGIADETAYGMTLMYLMGLVVVGGLAIMAIYSWMNRYVLTDPRFYSPEDVKKGKSKPKMTMMESFKYLAKSKYMLLLATIVFCYGVAINLIEVTWKGQLRLLYPDKTDYSHFMGMFSFFTGMFTIIMMLFVGGNFIRRAGWTKSALFTPVVLGVTGAGFFVSVIWGSGLTRIFALSASPVLLAVVFGTIQNVFSKGSKYSLFDPTKEMAYIPLDQEQKVKGKAAIDVVGARLGKSGGSLIQQLLLVFVPFASMGPYIAVVLFGIIALWIGSAGALGRQFNQLTKAKEEESKAAAAAKVAENGGQVTA